MGTKEAIKLFEEKRVRTAWDDEQEKWYFSIVDVVQVLTDSDYQTARKYWKVLKGRIVQEAGQPVTICYQLKMRAADGKMRLTDVADTEQLFRIIQSIPSPKAEPFKRWKTVTMQRETQLCIVDKAGMLLYAPMRVCCTAQSHRCITFLCYFAFLCNQSAFSPSYK